MKVTSIFHKLKNGDYPIITLEWRRAMRPGMQSSVWRWQGLVGMAIFAPLLLMWVREVSVVSGGSIWGNVNPGSVVGLAIAAFRIEALYLLTPIYAARTIAGERESGSFPALALTPLSSRSIVYQKLACALGPAAVATALSLLYFVPGLATLPGLVSRLTLGTVGLGYPITALSFAVIGICYSCRAKVFRAALAATYVWIYLFTSAWIGNRPMTRFLSLELALCVDILVFVVLPLVLSVVLTGQSIRRLDYLRTHAGGAA